LPGSVAQRSVPLLAEYIRAPSTVGAPQCCVGWTPLLSTLAVRSQFIAATGAELNRRLRNARIPNVLAKGPSIARNYSAAAEIPFADIDLNVRPADFSAALSVCGPRGVSLERRFRLNTPSLAARRKVP
jgi:hypothetical protein